MKKIAVAATVAFGTILGIASLSTSASAATARECHAQGMGYRSGACVPSRTWASIKRNKERAAAAKARAAERAAVAKARAKARYEAWRAKAKARVAPKKAS